VSIDDLIYKVGGMLRALCKHGLPRFGEIIVRIRIHDGEVGSPEYEVVKRIHD